MIERRPRTLQRAVLLLVVLAVMVGTAVAGRAQSKWRLEPGDTVPVLVGADTAGDPITFDFKAQRLPTIVYSIAPFSKYVVANEKRFASLLKQTRGRFNVVVMVPEHSERTAEYVRGVKSGWGDVRVVVITDVSKAVYRAMFLGAYPMTVVVSPESRVLANFMGAYDEGSLSAKPQDIEGFFHVRLPRS